MDRKLRYLLSIDSLCWPVLVPQRGGMLAPPETTNKSVKQLLSTASGAAVTKLSKSSLKSKFHLYMYNYILSVPSMSYVGNL